MISLDPRAPCDGIPVTLERYDGTAWQLAAKYDDGKPFIFGNAHEAAATVMHAFAQAAQAAIYGLIPASQMPDLRDFRLVPVLTEEIIDTAAAQAVLARYRTSKPT